MKFETILIDLTHTSHTRALTGIQRVSRGLVAHLGKRARPICFDRYLLDWRPLAAWEFKNLAARSGGRRRGARWPVGARLRGYLARWLSLRQTEFGPSPCALLCPEIFSGAVAAALPELFGKIGGPRAAIFHDALALQFPEFTPISTVSRYPGYLQDLLTFDGVAAVSEDSRSALVDYWRWLGIRDAPPTTVIALGVDLPPGRPPDPRRSLERGPAVLCVGTIEGRKNHLALLEACEKLWAEGERFELRIVGLARPETAGAAIATIGELIRAGRPLRYDGAASDQVLEEAYAEATFTVYPSPAEGFGLPVAESLARGKPCVCSSRGALGEISRGGGCLGLESMDREHLADAIRKLAGDPGEIERLGAAARARSTRSWADYASDVAGWLETLTRRGN